MRRQFHYSRTLKKIPNCCVSRPGHFVGSRFNHNFLFAFPSTLNSLSQQRKIDTHIRLLYRNDEVVYISYIYSIYSPVNWLIIKQKKSWWRYWPCWWWRRVFPIPNVYTKNCVLADEPFKAIVASICVSETCVCKYICVEWVARHSRDYIETRGEIRNESAAHMIDEMRSDSKLSRPFCFWSKNVGRFCFAS